VPNYKRANFPAISRGIANRIVIRPEIEDVETAWTLFKNALNTLTKQYIPTITIKNKYSASWIDAEVIRMSHKKKCAYQKWKRTKRQEDKDKFKKLRNNIKNLVNTKYKQYIENITTSLVNNPKRFWTLLKDRTKSKTNPSMLVHDNIEETDPKKTMRYF
jgi:hypothetical protein